MEVLPRPTLAAEVDLVCLVRGEMTCTSSFATLLVSEFLLSISVNKRCRISAMRTADVCIRVRLLDVLADVDDSGS